MIKKSVHLEKAPAKINLFLQILDKREDSYHNLETVFQAIELADHLTFSITISSGTSEDIDFNVFIDSNNNDLIELGMDNLIVKAIELYFTYVPTEPIISSLDKVDIEIFVDKQIPMQAGLGGASADAAATLRALNSFFASNFNWSIQEEDLLKIASELGSDVPFCLVSNTRPRVYAESRGEEFKPREINFDYDQLPELIIIKPNFGIATSEAYKLFDKGNSDDYQTELSFYNNFEPVIFKKHEELIDIRSKLLSLGASKVLLSGSGSSIIGFFTANTSTNDLIKEIQASNPEFQVFGSRFLRKD